MPRMGPVWRRLRRAFARARRDLARWWNPPLGARGERVAAAYLRRQGMRIVSRGAHVRRGEIDLVAVDGRTVVFAEVKTRASLSAGTPVEAVDAAKQRRLSRLALVFLRRHDLLGCAARFDVVAVTWLPGQRRPTIEHFRNAFEVVGRGQMFA